MDPVKPAPDDDSDDETPHGHGHAHGALAHGGGGPRKGALARCVGFFDSQAGATLCSIWLCLILKVVQQARPCSLLCAFSRNGTSRRPATCLNAWACACIAPGGHRDSAACLSMAYEAEGLRAAQAYIDGLPIFTEGAYGWAPAYCGILLGALGLSAPLVNFSVGGLASRGLPDRVITARPGQAMGCAGHSCSGWGCRHHDMEPKKGCHARHGLGRSSCAPLWPLTSPTPFR